MKKESVYKFSSFLGVVAGSISIPVIVGQAGRISNLNEQVDYYKRESALLLKSNTALKEEMKEMTVKSPYHKVLTEFCSRPETSLLKRRLLRRRDALLPLMYECMSEADKRDLAARRVLSETLGAMDGRIHVGVGHSPSHQIRFKLSDLGINTGYKLDKDGKTIAFFY